MANKMSLGFVNDTHRGARDSLVSARMQTRAKPPPPQPLNPNPSPADAALGGASSHGVVPVIESKKQLASHTVTPEPATRDFVVREPRDSNTFERRLEYAVNQVRGLHDTVGTLQGSVRTLETSTAQGLEKLGDSTSRASKLSASLLTIRGTCVAEAPQFKDAGGSTGDAVDPIARGTTVVLAYPMVREQGAVLMRRMNVNPHTAAVSWTWVVLYRNDGGGEVSFVSDFSC